MIFSENNPRKAGMQQHGCSCMPANAYQYGYRDNFGSYGMYGLGELTEEDIKKIVVATRESLKEQEISFFDKYIVPVIIGMATVLAVQIIIGNK